IIAGLMSAHDALLFSFPLLAGLASFKLIFSEEGALAKSTPAPCYVMLVFAPLGLLPLVKGTMFSFCGAMTVLCAAFFLAHKQRVFALTCLCSPLVSMVFFWGLAGQSVRHLPNYFMSMAPITSGYTEAMAVNGDTLEVILYLIVSAFLLL